MTKKLPPIVQPSLLMLAGLALIAIGTLIALRHETTLSEPQPTITEADEEVPEVVVGDGEQEPTYTTPRSSGWTAFRNAWVQKNPYCVMCGTTGNPHVHHVKSFHEHPELELSLDNLVTLCGPKEKNCHLYWGHDRDGKYGPESANWKTNNPNLRKHIQEYGY